MLGPLAALAAAAVFFLMSFGVVEDTTDVKYLPLALGLWVLSFALGSVVGVIRSTVQHGQS